MPNAANTLGTVLDDAARSLTSTSPTPRIDAEALLMHVLGVSRAALITRANETIRDDRLDEFRRLSVRRQAGEPIAYIIGAREFWSLPLKVTPSVLIPRPETELLVERALQRIPRDADYKIADLGTGSGAVGLAIAHDRPHCHVVATDVSIDALDVAKENAHRLGISNIEFRQGHWFEPIATERFHVIVSNPPYIRKDDPHLQQGDLRFEPRTALTDEHDGLEEIRCISFNAGSQLQANGWLIFEHGYDQAKRVAAILGAVGLSGINTYNDHSGQPRVTEARR